MCLREMSRDARAYEAHREDSVTLEELHCQRGRPSSQFSQPTRLCDRLGPRDRERERDVVSVITS
jgi:flagellar biosynthesis/type III secretory pathway ATPase